jgi:hypothetical protein
MIYRTMDPTFANEVANHPEVRPFLGGEDGPLDLTHVVQNPANYVLEVMGEGVWVLRWAMAGVYDLHTLFLPEARGKTYFTHAREALRWMFTRTDCLEITTQCPDDNPGARMAASMMGFRERFRREAAWVTGAGVSYRVFSVDDWFVRDKACLLEGRKFHEALELEKAAAGSTLEAHPEDATHDRAVGATALMILAGNTAKGVNFYNRWGVLAGYAPIVAMDQHTLDVRDAIVEIHLGQMRVLHVRSAPEE